uniref:U-actitoxin-Aer2a n=1 Tax=Anemonia erythraea TaxID=48400 RepID=AETX2_ANEER|nr:RecName: Full=U-actitoxin-Aer2a; Short=U-AITX-Aer2a; AltName: Full=AETX II; AltName: Full=Toxin AETX-2 [Anemonia erythraea]
GEIECSSSECCPSGKHLCKGGFVHYCCPNDRYMSCGILGFGTCYCWKADYYEYGSTPTC